MNAKLYYVVNLEVYVRKQPEGPFYTSNSPADIVERLIKIVSVINRNVTFDNWYTSFDLMVKLLKDHQITAVATVRKNKRCISNNFLCCQDRKVKSSLFGFQKDVTLLSYIPTKNKKVILISTLHHDNKIDEQSGDRILPEVITF